MMSFLDLFKNKNNEENMDSYELFLTHIDELSVKRLRSIDIAVDVIRHQFLEEGFVLSEIDCVSPLILLRRNQFGFYVDETKSLNSKEEFKNYLFGKEFLEKNKDVFKRLNQLLVEKEIIMRGSYNIVKGRIDEVNQLAIDAGYGVIRDKTLFESDPVHPSDEYVNLQILLDLVNTEGIKSYNMIIDKALNRLRECLSDDITLEIKRLDDTYGKDFDHTYGILLVDKNLGELFMLYYSDGMSVKKITYDKYIKVKNPYLDIYMRIILKCLQKELLLNDNKRRGK